VWNYAISYWYCLHLIVCLRTFALGNGVRVPLMKIQLFHAHVLMASKNFLSAFKTNSDDYRQLEVPVLLGLGFQFWVSSRALSPMQSQHGGRNHAIVNNMREKKFYRKELDNATEMRCRRYTSLPRIYACLQLDGILLCIWRLQLGLGLSAPPHQSSHVI